MDIKKWRTADYRAEVFHMLHNCQRWFIHTYNTFKYRQLLKLQGVSLGRSVAFNGPIHVDRFKHSLIQIGDNTIFNSHIAFNPRGINQCILYTANDFSKIIIGNNCGFSGVSIVANIGITIGDNVTVGANVRIGDTDDHPDLLKTTNKEVRIGNNVFIGMNSMIMKGVTIGDNAVIGAGSIVTKDIPANTIAVGVPCKVIRNI